LFVLRLLTADELKAEYGSEPQERGHHWLASLASDPASRQDSSLLPQWPFRVVHFYGYKGGQARSTVLALIALSLAEEGWKVLAVDSDLEAPSLDIIFGRTVRPLAGTLLGIAQGGGEFSPERVRVSSGNTGYVDLLACRPRRSEYDIDWVRLL
jgi:Mrp family chromosome partitioning ATPase